MDGELIAPMDGLGAQIGLFLGRRQGEEQAAELLERKHLAWANVNAAGAMTCGLDLTTVGAAHSNPRLAGLVLWTLSLGELNRTLELTHGSGADHYRYRGEALASALDELIDLAQLRAGRLSLRQVRTVLVRSFRV